MGFIPFYIKSEGDTFKYGYADLSGNTVIQPTYDSAMPFSNGYAVVQKDGKEFTINAKNEKCTSDFSLNELQFGNMADCFVTYDKLLDNNRETLFTCEKGTNFANINCVYRMQDKNINPVYIIQNDNNKRGAVDKYGNQLLPFEYDFINLFINGYSTGVKDGKLYVFRLLNMPVADPQPASTDEILYTNYKLDVSLTLPASWKGEYEIKESSSSITFLHKASEDNNGGGLLFCVARHDDMWTPDAMERGANSFAMLTDKYTYTFIRATGVEYTDTSEAEYKKLEADISSIKKTIQNIAITNIADPTYDAVGKTDENGLTDDYIYTFAKGSIDAASGDCLLMINGSFSATKVIIVNNRTLVPIRVISEAFGTNVLWDSSTNTVRIYNGNGDNNQILLKIGDKTAIVYGKTITLDVAPIIDNGLTYVPIRFVSEILNKAVGYLPNVGENNTKIVLAINPVVWVDDSVQIDEKTVNATLASLKFQFKEGLAYMKANYSTDIHYENIDAKTMESTFAKIENDIQKTQCIGQVGRYLVFQGPYLTLVDLNSGETYFYGSGSAFCRIHKANMNDVEVFGVGYFFG